MLPIPRRALSAAKALRAASGRETAIRWNAVTGAPNKIRGPFGEKNAGLSPRQLAATFLKRHHDLFSLKDDLSDINLSRTSESAAGHHVTFQQSCGGIPVEGGVLKVHLLRDGRVQTVSSRVSPRLRPDTRCRISRDRAIAISCRHLGLKGDLRGEIFAEKVVLPSPLPGTLVWKVSIPASDPCGDWVVMVHARAGTVLSVDDIRMFATGQANVFDPNPVVTLERTDLSDEDDAASAVPEEAYSTVVLEGLDNTGYLRGPYVDTGLTSSRAYSPQLDFRCDRSHRTFEEVMIYYHVQQFQKYLQEDLGVFPETRQVLADAHATPEDNSYFSPLIRAIYFGDGGVDDAEDAYLILHEYVHAVTYDIIRDATITPESNAMGEGTSDYFAASFFADREFQPATFAHWDGIANTPIGVRRLDSNKVYPGDMVGEGHSDGEIWSSALWHVRQSLGRETTDKIVAESVHYLDGSSQFGDGLQALLLADDALYAGVHAATISAAFADRGILPESLMSLGETRDGMLSKGDLTMPDGSYYDPYSFSAVTGQVVKVSLTSNDFDAYLILADPVFNTLATGDDLADGSTNARIIVTIPYSGTYHIFANAWSQGDTGQYSLSLAAGSLSEGTCQSTALPFGRQLSGHLGSGDFFFDDDTYYEDYTFAGHVGQEVTASMSSSDVDASLFLYDAGYAFLAQDDDGGPGSDSLLTYTLPYDGEYILTAGEFEEASGDYTLLLTSSDTALSVGAIVSGTLEDGDLTMDYDSTYFDPYQFQGTAGQTLGFKMYSTDLDPYLIVYNPYFNPIIEVDNASATDLNAVFEEFRLKVPGTYFVIANTCNVGETGDYKLAVHPVSVTDTDSDGYSDHVEIAESTNPLDASSVPDDVDGDFLPDSMDPDNDNDGMPNLWELDRGFDPLDDADADDDPDLDGVPNLAEFVADTDPHDAQSFFRVLTLARQDNELTLRWNSSSRRRYAVHRTTDFLHWTIIEPEFASQGDVTVWTDAGAFTNPAAFYRIEVFPPDP